MDMLGGDGISKQCRTADIMADAAYAILTKTTEFTGNFVVDEDILKQEGVQDFEQYAVQPGTASSADTFFFFFFLIGSPFVFTT